MPYTALVADTTRWEGGSQAKWYFGKTPVDMDIHMKID
jgi:hypothetical protein